VVGGIGLRPAHAPKAHFARRAGRRPAPQEPFVVKLLTDDPDVIIYWIADTRGEFE
jgi:hypothetical protein